MFRVAIDTGGTFTDLFVQNEESGAGQVIKVPSTPREPHRAVLEAIQRLGEEKFSALSFFAHATTLGTNALLGQMGLPLPRTALLTTEGFRDIVEIGRQNRPELYNLFFQKPVPPIPRNLRFTVSERVGPDGKIFQSVDEEALRECARLIREKEVQSVAVCFLHSCVNPENERRAFEILSRFLPRIPVVLSSDVNPEHREYERFSTTLINALLIPVLTEYLEHIQRELRSKGISAPFYQMVSSGGLVGVERIKKLPVATIESGPAAGVTAASLLSRLLHLPRVLSLDMGGTTAKAGLAKDGSPRVVNEYEVGGKVHASRYLRGSGYPVRYPCVDLAEVSAGGGTIVRLNAAGQLTVGPLSAGAMPGPACYDQGGEEATLTDAHLLLGHLHPAHFLGGEMPLSIERARWVWEKRVSGPQNWEIEASAWAALQLSQAQIKKALRLVSADKGENPAHFTLVAFGGAGPLHACALAEALHISSVVIPFHPGFFSAFGLLQADGIVDLQKHFLHRISRGSKSSEELLFTLLQEFFLLQERARTILREEGFLPEDISIESLMDARYFRQSYEISIPLPPAGFSVEDVLSLFHQQHRKVYGYAFLDDPVEIVNLRVRGIGKILKPEVHRESEDLPIPPPESRTKSQRIFWDGEWMEVPAYQRESLLPGNLLTGPAIVFEYDSTTLIPSGWMAKVDGYRNLQIHQGG